MVIEQAVSFGQNLLPLVPRTMVATLLIPVFATKYLPAGARFAVALGLVWLVALGKPVEAIDNGADQAIWFAMLLLKESVVGLMIGLSFGMVFWIARTIGELVDYQTSSTFAQSADPINGQNASTLGMFLEKLFVVYAVASGALLMFADVLMLSFEVWPVQMLLPDLIEKAGPLLILESSRLFAFGLLLAGPMLLIVLMIDVGFGLVGRTAPQLNLLNLTLPLKAPVAVFVLMLALPFLLSRLYEALGMVRQALMGLFYGG